MAQQTINVGAAPNDGTGTPLRTAFQYTNSNFTELYTAVGPSGNNIVVPGNATISGAANFNGGALAAYLNGSLLVGSSGNVVNLYAQSSGLHIKNNTGAFPLLTVNNSGDYTFQDGAGGTRMTLNSTGLGVGGSPVAASKLTVVGGNILLSNAYYLSSRNAANTTSINLIGRNASDEVIIDADGYGTKIGAGSALQIVSSGNVGIGVTPSAWVSYKSLELPNEGYISSGNNWMAVMQNAYLSGSYKYKGNGNASYYLQQIGEHRFYTAPSGTAGNAITFTQAMTLDASGNLLVGTTTTSGNAGGLKLSNVSGNRGEITFSNNSGAADYVARFNYGSTPTLVGNITVSSGGTSFVTTSDYRLKESVVPLSGGLARVSALKPSTYKWKADGSNGEGFIAHELAEVVPLAVTGEKDAVNEDGSIRPQGVDLSKVVPVLVAAIQELTARVQTLETC